jgi:hypothetical protein
MTITSGSISVLNLSGTLVKDFNANRIMLSIDNVGTSSVEIAGASPFTWGTGYTLLGGNTFRCSDYIGSVFCQASGANVLVSYSEETI